MTAGTNSVSYGPNKLVEQDFTGLTVGEVREEYEGFLNIPSGATANINGIAVDDSQRIVNGENLVFSKPLGEKGSL